MRALLGGLIAVAWIAIGGVEQANASALGKPISSPRVFVNDLQASIASDGKSLWMAKLGMDRNETIRTRVFAFTKGGWKPLPGAPRADYQRAVLAASYAPESGGRAQVCVADAVRSNGQTRPRLRCFKGGKWNYPKIDQRLASMSMTSMESKGTNLTAIFYEMGSRSSTVQASRLQDGELKPFGPPLELDGQYLAMLGSSTDPTAVGTTDVALEKFADGNRYVATLSQSGWSISEPIGALEIGPMTSGSVRSGETLFMPVTQAFHGARAYSWPFTVFRRPPSATSWKPVGVVNRGKGSAQGGIYAVGNRVWAIWNQNIWRSKSPRRPAKILASRVNRRGDGFDKTILLHRGLAPFAGDVQAVEYRGRPLFLFPCQFNVDKGMFATVRSLRK